LREGNKLSAAAVRNAKDPGLYGDGHGLYLQVSAFGTKAWLFRYMIDGKARKMGLGAIHTVSLAEARKRAADARLKVHDGIDPIQERETARVGQKLEAARAMTFKECVDKYIEENRPSWKNDKHADQWVASFNQTKRGKTVFPAATQAINDLPVSVIDTALMLKVLKPIWTRTPESASRIRGRIERVLGWATVHGYRSGENPARWRGHLKEALASRSVESAVKHHDALPYAAMPEFMAAVRDKSGVSARALEFTILAAARTGEVIGARWSEISEVEIEIGEGDRKRAEKIWVWQIPAERMKAGKAHRIPLSERALEILSALPREGDFVFLGAGTGKPLSNMAMLELVRGMRGKGATVHGFRSTFRDWAAEQTSYPNELCEIALAHAVSDKTEATYRRGDMMKKRRRLMADWSTYCERLPAAKRELAESGKVVPIRSVGALKRCLTRIMTL
jgi:integrase